MGKNLYSYIWIIYGILGCILVIISTYSNFNEVYFLLLSFIYGFIGLCLLFSTKILKNKKSFNEIYKEDLENINKSNSDNETLNTLNKLNTKFNNHLNSVKPLEISETQNIDKFNSSINNKVFNSNPNINTYNTIINESFSNISNDIFH